MATTDHSIDSGDPWAMADNGYDVDNFYIRATDGRGHSENIQSKLSPAIVGQLNALIATGVLPYRTIQDFIRDACLHRAKYVSGLVRAGKVVGADGFKRVLAAEMLLVDIEQAAERTKLGEQMLEKVDAEVRRLLTFNKRSEAWDRIQQFVEVADQWQDETIHEQMIQAVERWQRQATSAPVTMLRHVD